MPSARSNPCPSTLAPAFGFLLCLLTSAILLCAAIPSNGQDLRQAFLDPPSQARPMMRWWWFGPAVVKPELEKELATMHAAGIGGVEIQPVYPLVLDDPAKGLRNLRYLSPQFLDDVSFANRAGRSLGMRVSITLGSGWPYGGPHTPLALAAEKLKVLAVPAAGPTTAPPQLATGDALIATFVAQGSPTAYDPATARQIDSARAIPANGNFTVLSFIAGHTRQQVKRAAYGAEGFVLDHFSRPALDEHLRNVAIPLLAAFGNQPPDSVFSDSLEVYGSDWTANLPAEFRKRRGYDLVPHLPELLAGGTPQAEAVRHDWGQTLSDLIRQNYLEPLAQFARQHGTLFRSQTYGEPAVTLADEAVPQLPEGEGPQWRTFSYARWAASAGHLDHRNLISAETWTWLHSPAFRATPLDMKAEADRMFLIGINQFVGHGWPYSPPQAGEPGWAFYAAAVFNNHNPWFPVMPDVMRYLTRVSWLLRQGAPANDVAILLPEDDAQAAFTPGHVSVTGAMQKYITPELMGAILDAGYNVDYIDAATIAKLGAIPYPVLVIPPTTRIPLAAYRLIEKFAAGRGKVIAIGKAPSLAPGLLDRSHSPEVAAVSERLFRAANHPGVFIASPTALAAALHSALPPDLEASGRVEGLGFIHRRLAASDIYFVANTGNRPIDGFLHFRAARQSIEAWDPDSGDVLLARGDAGNARVSVHLAPYESRVFVLSGDAPAHRVQAVTSPAASRQLADLSTGWRVRFRDSPADQPLAALASWTEIPGRQFYSGEADYTRRFALPAAPAPGTRLLVDFGSGTPVVNDRPPGAPGMHALLDPPIREAAIVLVNGRRVGALWHPPYRMNITSFVRPGENLIEVRVYNTAINELAGQPPRDNAALYARYGKRFEPQDMQNLKPVPSGLLGPVRLLAASE
ncbi:MAG: glycosyl hydrolase [Acidobacteriota bacterium]